MNIGRIIVGCSAVAALAAAFAFGAELSSPGELSLPQGNEICASSQIEPVRAFGIDAWNDSDHPVTLSTIEIGSLTGMQLGKVWMVPAAVIARDGGILGMNEPTDADTKEWVPLDGTVVNPGESVDIVLQLTATAPAGMATDFRVTYEGNYGMSRTAMSPMRIGFYSADPASDEESVCGE